MINKKSLWFLTLFSLILVLSVYYITMPSELLIGNNSYIDTSVSKEEETPTVNITESDILTALRIEKEEQLLEELDALKLILSNEESTVEEKNNAFEKMKDLNIKRGEEEGIEKEIEEQFKMKAFVKIDGDQIRVVVASDTHDKTLANNIMRTIQDNYDKKMYISVKFQK